MKTLVLLALAIAPEIRAAGPPLGLDLYMPVPETNRLTPAKVALGKRLFFDKRLSRDGTLACAGCHDPKLAFSDGRAVARGVGAAEGTRNSPAIVNRGYGALFFWDGRAKTLEQQVLEPILNPKELALTQAELERRTGLKTEEVTAALASYVRTIRSGDSRFDRYAASSRTSLSVREKAGLALFQGKANCWTCHSGPNFTDERFHNTGVAWRDGTLSDIGAGQGNFKTPTLREVARTAPYMHDGTLKTLENVVDFYSEGGRENPSLDAGIRPLNLSSDEKHALVAFLRSLTGKLQEGRR
ncbi:MAG: cytochrome c peroxidase [Acidobacteriota bacterium]